ncbi:LysR family transcriptional regulator [Corallococcus sp. ZKHCc1 1396]|uniref:LysR family transcriptional regulator n=1 Tax=Corallococcus soli TaxID=2710757 RepID=A0ABR9PYV4_9BACT|nr:LysR family transcriptional regulator [Corallococcus soli]MBE4753106.1 LysR family transcriptional regulator [Corallococcus soli]
MIQLQRLEGFYWVARMGGYTRAVRAFPYPITQPGIYQQVKRLTEEVGVELFTRVGKDRMALTPAGRELYAFVAPFLEGLPQVARSLKTGERGGTLRIHASNLVLRHLLPPWLGRLRGVRPDIQVRLFESAAPELARLRLGETDLLVDHLPELPHDVESREVGRVKGFIVLPRAHALARSRSVNLKQLEAEPFIGYGSDHHLLDLQLRALALHDVHPRQVHSADSAESILAFVAAGLGFSLVPSFQPEGPRAAGVVAWPLTRPRAEFPIHAVWLKSRQPAPLMAAAMAFAPVLER